MARKDHSMIERPEEPKEKGSDYIFPKKQTQYIWPAKGINDFL